MRAARFVRATVLGAVVGLAACGGSAPGSSASATGDPELRRGKAVYDQRCQACHGPRGTGGIGPALGNGKVVEKYPNSADQIAVVTNGKNAMPAWGKALSAEDIAAVVRYERELLGR